MDVRTLTSWANQLRTRINSWAEQPKARKSVGTIQDVLSGKPRMAFAAAICNGGCASCGAAGCDSGGSSGCSSCGSCSGCGSGGE